MSASPFGIASGTRGTKLDVTGPSDGSVPRAAGTAVASRRFIMSGIARHRDGWLPVLLLVAFLVLALGSGAAWPAVGFSGGGHGGFAGGHGSGSFPRGRGFGSRGFGGRPFPHGHDRDHAGRPFLVVPYFYDPYYGYDPDYPDYPYDAYCDPYSPYYAPQYC